MTDTSDTESAFVPKAKGKEKEITVVQDQGYFTHDTGDTYDGFFEAKKKDRSVKMHGPGTYTTAQGDIYTCLWENDKISSMEEATITFTDGSKYEGIIRDWSYNGPGKYTYPDGSVLTGNFIDNCPVGSLVFTDPNGHIWTGPAEQGFAWFEPNNHYYDILEKVRDLCKIKRRKPKVAQSMAAPAEAAESKTKKVQLVAHK